MSYRHSYFVCFLLHVILNAGGNVWCQHSYQEGRVEKFEDGTFLNIQDEKGFFWGSNKEEHLIRFDGFEIITFSPHPNDPNSICGFVRSAIEAPLFKDKNQKIWLILEGCTLARYDPETSSFENFSEAIIKCAGHSPREITSTYEDTSGDLWWTSQEGLLKFDIAQEVFSFFPYGKGEDILECLYEDSQDQIWCLNSAGLVLFDKVSQSFTENINLPREKKDELLGRLINDFGPVYSKILPLDQKDHFLIQEISYLLLVDLASKTYKYLDLPLEKEELIISSVYSDSGWLLGTSYGRIWKYDEVSLTLIPFALFKEVPEKGFMISNLLVDREGIIHFTKTHERKAEAYHIFPDIGISFTPFKHDALTTKMFVYQGDVYLLGSRGLSSVNGNSEFAENFNKNFKVPNPNIFVNPLVDNKGDIWAATGRFILPPFNVSYIYEFSPDGNLKSSYSTQSADTLGYLKDAFMDIVMDSSGIIWIGSWWQGVIRFDPQAKSFQHFSDEKRGKGKFFKKNVRMLMVDSHNTLWAAYGSEGISKMNLSSQEVTHFVFDPKDTTSLSNNNISCIQEDKHGNIWIGTFLGLNRWEPDNASFSRYFKNKGLAEDGITSIVLDQNGDLWVFTVKMGLIKYQADTDDFLTISIANTSGDMLGFQKSFTSRGEIFSLGLRGTQFGINQFHPDDLRIRSKFPSLFLTDFNLYTDNGNQKINLDPYVSRNKPIELKYQQNTFTLKYTAQEYAHPDRIHFAFKLEGIEEHWREVGQSREASYTDLRPGRYTFKLISSNIQGKWSEDGPELTIEILPPWWATWWAYSSYALVFISGLYLLYRYQLNRQLAKAETLRLKELDEVKTKLYTNITHEFRTPLTVIQGMTDKMEEKPDSWFEKGISMIRRNSSHLLRLVNQLLDLAKLESGNLALNQIQADIIPYLYYLVESFQSYAETKGVEIHLLPQAGECVMDYDPDRFLDIISNLLSNAIKFTPEGGNVYVAFREENGHLLLSVRDTGMGIAEEKLPYIFDRFYQVDDSSTRKGEGTGVGLALTRELVKLMGGTIKAQSIEGKGSEFMLSIPISRTSPATEHLFTEEKAAKTYSSADRQQTAALPLPNPDLDLPLALIAEDNEDVITYLVSCLEADYRLEIARDGQEGIEKALELVPDIIVSDVMMPHKDGFELTDTLKHDVRTSHVPIVLLTAKADVESRLAGLRRGADAYLAKPFNEEELQIRMAKLLEVRDAMRQRYSSPNFVKEGAPSPTPETEQEDAFITQVRGVVMDHLDDPNLDVTKLCRELGLSRSPLHNKLKALTGMSTTEFIRFVRLSKASELLRSLDAPVSEIAYQCGFQNHNYFSKKFGEVFGVSPTGWRGE